MVFFIRHTGRKRFVLTRNCSINVWLVDSEIGQWFNHRHSSSIQDLLKRIICYKSLYEFTYALYFQMLSQILKSKKPLKITYLHYVV